jgi:hypothetical protein
MHRATPLAGVQEDGKMPIEDHSSPGGIFDNTVSDTSLLSVAGNRSWSVYPNDPLDITQISSSPFTNQELESNHGDRYVTYSPSIYSSKISEDSGPSTVIGPEEQSHHTHLGLLAVPQGSIVLPSALPSSDGAVDMHFRYFERGAWIEAVKVRAVSPADTSRVERSAKNYIRRGFSLYDRDLQSLSPAQCFRAANEADQTIYMISNDQNKALEKLESVQRHLKLSSAMSTVALYEENRLSKRRMQHITEESEEEI